MLKGTLQGTDDQAVVQFKGIPYAAPPTGKDGRFKPPRPAATWKGVRDASAFGPKCLPNAGGSEDCLYLNVYAPGAAASNGKAVPVLFWVHGGSFQRGSGQQSGVAHVQKSRGKVIVVGTNYRLGIFGFLAAEELRSRDPQKSTGNYGLQDQRAAMAWVQTNIAAFGGDPKQVLLFGESAGSASVANHLARPASWPYFSAAGLESGPFYLGPTTAGMRPVYEALLDHVKCTGLLTNKLDCLLGKDSQTLVDANQYFQSHVCTSHPTEPQIVGKCGWWPSIDGVEMLQHTNQDAYLASIGRKDGHLAPVPILIGSNREDLEDTVAATPGGGKSPPSCTPQLCSESDFRTWAASLGLSAKEVADFVAAYKDEGSDESGTPVKPLGASKWYWAMHHAGTDAKEGCQARRLALVDASGKQGVPLRIHARA